MLEDEADFGDFLFEFGKDVVGYRGVEGGGPFDGGKVISGGGVDGELGVADEAAGGFETVKGLAGEMGIGRPIVGVVDVQGAGELGGGGGEGEPGFLERVLGRGAFGNPTGGFGGVVDG